MTVSSLVAYRQVRRCDGALIIVKCCRLLRLNVPMTPCLPLSVVLHIYIVDNDLRVLLRIDISTRSSYVNELYSCYGSVSRLRTC